MKTPQRIELFDGVELTTRARIALGVLGCVSVDDYRSTPRYQVARLKNVGLGTFNELETKLRCGQAPYSLAQFCNVIARHVV